MKQRHAPGGGDPARIARQLHRRSPHRIGEHIEAVNARDANVIGLHIGDAGVGLTFAGGMDRIFREALRAKAFLMLDAIVRLHQLYKSQTLNARMPFADAQMFVHGAPLRGGDGAKCLHQRCRGEQLLRMHLPMTCYGVMKFGGNKRKPLSASPRIGARNRPP